VKPPRVPFKWDEHRNPNARGELANWIIQYQGQGGGKLPVVVGLVDECNRALVHSGRDFLYGDHSYFQRGWAKNNFRLIRNGHHQTQVFKRPDDRLKRWDVQIEPWRTGGRSIVVIPPSAYYFPIYDTTRTWLHTTLETLRRHTERPIHIKESKGRLRECLLDEKDAFAVVCCMSAAGMEAALMGVPVFSTENCCSWGVNAGPLERIESPERHDRHAWACSLAFASWHASELGSIDFRSYEYSLKEAA
jgi:hypothetical protein